MTLRAPRGSLFGGARHAASAAIDLQSVRADLPGMQAGEQAANHAEVRRARPSCVPRSGVSEWARDHSIETVGMFWRRQRPRVPGLRQRPRAHCPADRAAMSASPRPRSSGAPGDCVLRWMTRSRATRWVSRLRTRIGGSRGHSSGGSGITRACAGKVMTASILQHDARCKRLESARRPTGCPRPGPNTSWAACASGRGDAAPAMRRPPSARPGLRCRRIQPSRRVDVAAHRRSPSSVRMRAVAA